MGEGVETDSTLIGGNIYLRIVPFSNTLARHDEMDTGDLKGQLQAKLVQAAAARGNLGLVGHQNLVEKLSERTNTEST